MDIPFELAVLGLGAAVSLLIYALLTQAEERSVVRESLKQLDGYEAYDSFDSQRDQELMNPLTERALMPVLGGLTSLGRRFTPVGYVDQVRKKHILAGRGTNEAVDRFLAIRVVTVLLVPVAFWLVYVGNPLNLEGMRQMAVFGLLSLALVLGPDARLNREVEARQNEIRRGLPDILDLLVISVEAGLGFEQALDRTINTIPGELSNEFSRMLGEVRAGSHRADAMRAMEARIDVVEVRSFVLAILQADTFGVSIGRVLRAQAEEMRIKRRQIAQEKAQKAPVKMLIPMVFCIFPALFVVVLGPAMINISRNF